MLAVQAGQVTQRARSHLSVLLADGLDHVVRRELVAHQLGRVQPDPHRALGAEQRGSTNARHTFDFVQHIARQVVAQRHRVEPAIGRRQRREQQEVGARLGHLHALLRHCRRKARLGALEAVLHVDRGQIRVGARNKADGDRALTVGLALRLHVQQAIGTVDFLLDHADHAFVQGLGRSPGVDRCYHHRRRGNRRVLRDRQAGHGDGADQQDEQRDHPGKHRTVDKEFRHAAAPLTLAASCRFGRLGAG